MLQNAVKILPPGIRNGMRMGEELLHVFTLWHLNLIQVKILSIFSFKSQGQLSSLVEA